MYDTILVGTDGSESANEAVEKAIDTAETHDATVHAVTIVNTRRYGEPALSSTELVLTEIEDRGREQLEKVEEMCENRGIEVVTKCFHGDPGEELLKYADEMDADMIVLGYQGRTHPRAKVGSTASYVVRHSDRVVLLV